MKTTNFITLLLLWCLTPNVQASIDGKITGQVVDQAHEPLEFFTVSLFQTQDSTLVKGEYTDANGKFVFEHIDAGQYFVTVSGLGYQEVQSEIFNLSEVHPNHELPTLFTSQAAQLLDEVIVKDKKPFITQQLDKMVLNIENSIVSSTGLSVLELLEKAPGVQVDNDGVISLRGKDKVLVMMDGKPTYLSSAALAGTLQAMQAESVKEIEIITNPSAKWEAEGNAGIINIRTKKSKNDGLNGNLNASLGYGQYWKENVGAGLNLRQGNLNLFGNYFFSEGKSPREYQGTNRFWNDGTPIGSQEFYGFRLVPRTTHTIKAGMDYSIGKNTIIGLLYNRTDSRSKNLGQNDIRILDGSDQLLFTTFSNNILNNKWSQWSGNINLIHEFGSSGKRLTFDLDYSQYDQQQNENVTAEDLDETGQMVTDPFHLIGDMPSFITITSGKLDYEHPFSKATKLEVGWKSSLAETDSDVQYFLEDKGNEMVEPEMSNHFFYKEYIHAGYLNLRTKLGTKWEFQAGFRAEQTIADGQQVTLGTSFERNYLNLFPSAFAQYTASEDHQFGLAAGRRIDRPSYQDLNPARSFYNRYAFYVGNPDLKPQYSNNYEFSYTFKGRYRMSVNYSRTTDIMASVFVQDADEGLTFIKKENFGLNRNWGISLSVPTAVTPWWEMYNFVNAYETVYEDAPMEELNQTFRALALTTNHSFKLPLDFKAEFSGWIKTGHVWGAVRSKAAYQFSTGIQRSFLDGNATVKLTIQDVFNSFRFSANQRYADSEFDLDFYRREGRIATLSFSYNFGKNTVKGARKRKTGIQDEERRMKGGNSL